MLIMPASFGGFLLRGRDFRFDFRPVGLHRRKPAFDFQRAIRVPHVIEKEQRADPSQHHHADFQRIALALPMFRNLLVQEVEMQRHGPLILQVFEGRAAGHIEGNEFIRQGLAFCRRQRHFTHFERIPNLAGQPEFIA